MNHESWNNILIEVSKKIPAVYYEPFITPLDLVHYDEKKIVLKAPSMAIKKHVEKRYQKYIEEAAFSLFGLKPDIEINTDIDRPVEEFSKQGFQDENFDFNPDYSFNNFVKGKANELAFTALLAALDKPGSINPIFIHGGVASGKTHLLHALGSAYKMKYPNLSVKYISISTFLQEFVSNVQNRNSIEAFRNKYKSYDLLLVDDMQYLNSGAEKTQEEFFNIFNYLYDRRKQIVIASDRYCSELPLND
ncbi:MAG: ATP-binding protein, partial [Leptospiraceae bacterium]|nr:ATP-binding protein [Leptospiraceae bacterium]